MSTVTEELSCDSCGQIYLADFNCRTGEVSKISSCACDKQIRDLEDMNLYLKNKLEDECKRSAILQEAMEIIASDTEEQRQTIAQETLEAIATIKER